MKKLTLSVLSLFLLFAGASLGASPGKYEGPLVDDASGNNVGIVSLEVDVEGTVIEGHIKRNQIEYPVRKAVILLGVVSEFPDPVPDWLNPNFAIFDPGQEETSVAPRGIAQIEVFGSRAEGSVLWRLQKGQTQAKTSNFVARLKQ